MFFHIITLLSKVLRMKIILLKGALPAINTGAEVPKARLLLNESQIDGGTLAAECRGHVEQRCPQIAGCNQLVTCAWVGVQQRWM